MTVLAIDQGTTSTRGFLLDSDGRLTHLITLTHRQHYPAPGWVEHDAEELLSHIRACLDAAAGAGVVAVGIDNQGESCLAWDAETGQALGPVIVWQDDRTAPETRALTAAGHEALVLDRAGLPLDPYFSASKLAWILRETPRARDLLAAGRLRLGTTDAFFRDRLTGVFATDVTTASRTSLMRLDECRWDADLCDLFGVPMAALPPIGPSSGDLGHVTIGARPVPLTASLVDQQAALFGHGCRAPGEAKITFGTGAFALALTGARVAPGLTAALPTVAWQRAGQAPVFALDGGVFTASAAVNWARGVGLCDDLAALEDFAHPWAATRGLVFVPALAGLACPHWNRAARGAFLGLGLETSRGDMMQAVLEGVAFRMAEVIDDMARALPLATPIAIDGGMTANRWFCQILADCLQRPLRVSDDPELTARGTALMAAEAAGLPPAGPPTGRLVTPRPLPPVARKAFADARALVGVAGRVG